MLKVLPVIFVFMVSHQISAQEKKEINSIDDIPRFSYKIDGKASEVYLDKEKFDVLYKEVKRDYTQLLEEYSFNDKTLRKSILGTLKQIDFYENNLDNALAKAIEIKELEDKPSAKLLSGMVNLAYIDAARNFKPETTTFREQFKKELAARVNTLPWDVVQDDVESTKGSMEIISENLFLGIMQENMDHVVSQTGELSGDFAAGMIGYKYNVQFIIPYKQEIIDVMDAYIKENFVEKENIWVSRDLDISNMNGLNEVVVAIWDSGVDADIFSNQMFTNKKEVIDGVDNDKNGYIDDVHGIAYDLKANKETSLLYPLDPVQTEKLPQMINMMKGLTDLQANIDSEESSELKRALSSIKPDEVKPFIEEISLFGNYAHGTHVAGIVANGNPKAMLMASRITFGYKMIPDVPTIDQAKKDAISIKETVNYYKAHNVRVVNMSFGGNPQGIESALELNGAGGTPEERKKLAREIFEIGKVAFYDAIKEADDILFIAAAGNSDNDAEFYEYIPSSFDLPNILTVGAVDQAGEETGFTSFGENVDVHANGFEVDSYIPGGEHMKMSGTSMASPNAANLAAKLLAIDPDLTVSETIELIKEGCDTSPDGKIHLVNPQKSIALLAARGKR